MARPCLAYSVDFEKLGTGIGLHKSEILGTTCLRRVVELLHGGQDSGVCNYIHVGLSKRSNGIAVGHPSVRIMLYSCHYGRVSRVRFDYDVDQSSVSYGF